MFLAQVAIEAFVAAELPAIRAVACRVTVPEQPGALAWVARASAPEDVW